MSGGEHDLSGRWSGIFSYPALLPPNSFEATIRDVGGAITGVIVQPREIVEVPGPPQQAVIEGRRQGNSVSWVKIYDDLTRPSPHYSGIIDPGGDEIEGEWVIPGDWSGTFIMVRARKSSEEAERRISEEV
jgi:hypothetical protein